MTSMDYLTIPRTATRIENNPTEIHPVKRKFTPLPTPSPSPSLPSVSPASQSPTNALFSSLPQMLFSTAIPGLEKLNLKDKPTKGLSASLLSTRDPLSLPKISTNFRRFVVRAGPIFWIQDRVEEIFFWKRGWMFTTIWISIYAFLCYFPRMVFLVPHAAFIAVLLGSYPYPDVNSESTTSTPTPSNSSTGEFAIWQGNIQAIQNLMGFISDTYDMLEPHTRHLLLTPAHVESSVPSATKSAQANVASLSLSPYPPYILLFLVLSFLPLSIVFSLSVFPVRLFCFVTGSLPIFANHPSVSPILLRLMRNPHFWVGLGQYTLDQLILMKHLTLQRLRRYRSLVLRFIPTWGRKAEIKKNSDGSGPANWEDGVQKVPFLTLVERILDDDRLDDRCWWSEMKEVELWENERFLRSKGGSGSGHPRSGSTNLDSSGLGTSSVDNSNEISLDIMSSASVSTTPVSPSSQSSSIPYPLTKKFSLSQSLLPTVLQFAQKFSSVSSGELEPGVWSKSNLRADERRGWTRGRDGWGGIRPLTEEDRLKEVGSGKENGDLVSEDENKNATNWDNRCSEGYVSNLTFSLSPGWSFVGTEGWRKDRMGSWAGIECIDGSGWVYTNDTWSDPRGSPDAKSVTRRRRWVRRIWYDGST